MKRSTHFIDFGHEEEWVLPFKMRINFGPIIDYYETLLESDSEAKRQFAHNQLEVVMNTPRLREPFDTFEELYAYEEEIHQLLDLFFPEILTTNEIKGAVMPYLPFFFRTTGRLQRIFDDAGEDFVFKPRQFDSGQMYIANCIFALALTYGVQFNTTFPIYYDIPSRKTGTTKHYRALHNADFAKIELLNKSLKMSEDDIRELSENLHDLELWKRKIPPNTFEFNGFGLVTLVDLTMDDALSSMKNILLQKDALYSAVKINELEMHLRDYFGQKDLHLGIARYDEAKKTINTLRDNLTHCMILDESDSLTAEECFCDSNEELIFDLKAPLIANDIDKVPDIPSPLIRHYKEKGVKSAIVMPLMYDEDIIGLVELTSDLPEVMNSVVASKMKEVLPLFSVALQRAIDEEQTQVEALVQEKFTSIHPTVAWKFFEIAENEMASGRGRANKQPDDIVFHDVIPLFGQFDIRGSSAARNTAIQKDLSKQLSLAESVLEKAIHVQEFPIYKALKFRLKEFRNTLKNGINAGDEVSILEFLTSEVYPSFNYMAESNSALRTAVDDYMTTLDPTLKVIYQDRREYEHSVTLINEELSKFIDERQHAAQAMLPHYFEKYKTDGIEYNVYLGQSLLQGHKYDLLHLQNLQLWQLLMTVEAEFRLRDLKPNLSIPLDITSLILVHTSPLSIRFRMDEKKFDVDGAYNIRYEIVKKRIDKAHIKNSRERLTQPGKIAVVYTQDREAEQYVKYLSYLQDEKLITRDIEWLELEDLQGTTGLKAFRVEIDYANGQPGEKLTRQLEEVMQSNN